MRKSYELRVNQQYASLLFHKNEGISLGSSIRKVTIASDDPRCAEIARLCHYIKDESQSSFFWGWRIIYEYSSDELANAQLFRLTISGYSETSAHEYGTRFQYVKNCSECSRVGFRARQIDPLFLLSTDLPGSKDFVRLNSYEIVISKKARETLFDHNITGYKLRPVYLGKKSKSSSDTNSVKLNHSTAPESAKWFQLIIHDLSAAIIPPTKIGLAPFSHENENRYKCDCGNLIGANLLSEVSIDPATRSRYDISATSQGFSTGLESYTGAAARAILVSPAFRQMVLKENLKGCDFEIAYAPTYGGGR